MLTLYFVVDLCTVHNYTELTCIQKDRTLFLKRGDFLLSRLKYRQRENYSVKMQYLTIVKRNIK